MGLLNKLFKRKHREPDIPVDTVNDTVTEKPEDKEPVPIISSNGEYVLYIESLIALIKKKSAKDNNYGTKYDYYCECLKPEYRMIPIDKYDEFISRLDNILDYFHERKNIKYECDAFYNVLCVIMMVSKYSGKTISIAD